ncbi:hypothetical protein PNEG_03139 [Pneumocystis murina B123]|uniref:Serine/threonine-protein phosphatase 2A activator n=1 Tax=Pneumocystis murina (strain B123) TaxID=1069680 RepID=M7P3A5_PNEMU|nr:hypothetical protein PNEG_03139 [Pneumocystis murina B123]EMR08295.1 hypothetical protein PNEG_03139 [Pneumocystis murina B123]
MSLDNIVPQRRIFTNHDLELFCSSHTYEDIFGFICMLNNQVQGIPTSETFDLSQNVLYILSMLEQIHSLIDRHPPIQNNKSRFGNAAFRSFYDDMEKSAQDMHTWFSLPENTIIEVSKYFTESWGNKMRIDYGSIHELHFISWLFCLYKINILTDLDGKALIIRVFNRYILVMRRIQTVYWLEPAGSHGAWGLDDYHFLPFLFGSAQLINHKYIRPRCIHDNDILEEFSKDFIYLDYIRFINSIKTVSLRWHSPMLDDISIVKQWKNVNIGMLKMYKAEVLSKFTIMQHYLFGRLIPAAEGMTQNNHNNIAVTQCNNTWGDCCGIRIPSMIGAASIDKKDKLRVINGIFKS